METTKFYSNGKLLLTAEYVVLDGAKAIALPTRCGQSMVIEYLATPELIWESYDVDNSLWYRGHFNIKDIRTLVNSKNDEVTKRLLEVLVAAMRLNPEFLNSTATGFKVVTYLDFNRFWGLGTSSTLINNIASWAKVDAYNLLAKTFGGSGYDLACAQHDGPITYKRNSSGIPNITETRFDPVFKENLHFVYLNKKQDSRKGIATYKSNKVNVAKSVMEVSQITEQILACDDLLEFQRLLDLHESIISKLVRLTPVKQEHFKDFSGSIKSLGAWGGDFILTASKENPAAYFHSKGFKTVIPYSKLILN